MVVKQRTVALRFGTWSLLALSCTSEILAPKLSEAHVPRAPGVVPSGHIKPHSTWVRTRTVVFLSH
jgi:hypothetical protein